MHLTIGHGDNIVEPLANEWVEEFSSLTSEQIEHQEARASEASYNQDFWKNLETEWKREVENNSKSAGWLEEFEAYAPYEQYDFVEDNPLKDHDNCLEEGKRKLAEGNTSSKLCSNLECQFTLPYLNVLIRANY